MNMRAATVGGAAMLLALAVAAHGYLSIRDETSQLVAPTARQHLVADAQSPVLLDRRVAAPYVEFAGPEGETITLNRFAGKIVVLSLWAPWCAPCVKEMPSLNMLVTLMPGIAVVPVNVDARGLNGASEFLQKHSLTELTPFYDPTGKMLGLLNGRGLPTSMILDRDGKLAAIVEGAADWTSKGMLDLLMRI